MYILIIASGIFYVKIFYFINHNNSIKKFNIKGNFSQIEISILIIIIFTQSYLNLYNIYTSRYYNKALKNEDPDDIISYYNRVEYEEKKPFPNYIEFHVMKPTNSFITPVAVKEGKPCIKYSVFISNREINYLLFKFLISTYIIKII